MINNHLAFSNLIGQDKAKSLLMRSIARDKMSHAYLFRGPAGVGKKRTALTLAAYVNCKSTVNHDVCGSCSSCRKFYTGNHPDLYVLRAEGAAIKINQIRKLKEALVFPPFEAQYRVVILEDVHTMRREAANSLLKTLEEPPPNNLLILTANETGELLATIVSRCQAIPFHPLPVDLVSRVMAADHGLPVETAFALAASAGGSLGRAELLLKKEFLPCRLEIVEQLLALLPGRSENVPAVYQMAEKTAELKENLGDFLDLLKLWFRDLILLAAGGPASLVSSRDLDHVLSAARGRWSLPELFDKLLLIEQAQKELLRNCNRLSVCEVLFFGLI